MEFKKIDINSWHRKHYYDYFMNNCRCRFGMTANIDITGLLNKIKELNLRCYPTFTYMVSRIINNHDEFKTSRDSNGNIGIWDTVNVRYPMFNEKDNTVTSIWLEYSDEFKTFYNNAIIDIEEYKGINNMLAKGQLPPNFYDITSIPWVSFTEFQLDMYGVDGSWLVPFVAIGKFFKQENRTLLPVNIKVHHAVCDGYHVGVFFKELQELSHNFEE